MAKLTGGKWPEHAEYFYIFHCLHILPTKRFYVSNTFIFSYWCYVKRCPHIMLSTLLNSELWVKNHWALKYFEPISLASLHDIWMIPGAYICILRVCLLVLYNMSCLFQCVYNVSVSIVWIVFLYHVCVQYFCFMCLYNASV